MSRIRRPSTLSSTKVRCTTHSSDIEIQLHYSGQMSLHHVKLIHGSPPNKSDKRRYGFAIRYVAPHVKQKVWILLYFK